MRIALCFRRDKALHRLIWLSESAQGLYYGFLGATAETHQSYHADGTRHTKMGTEYHGADKGVPISEWRGVMQLAHVSMSLSMEWLSTATAYAGDGKTETVVILDENHFRGGRSCSLDFWLLDRASESKLYELLAAHVAGFPDFTMLADVVASLDCFADHKVAITFRAGPPRA